MKKAEIVEELKNVWERDHAEEVSKAYNKVVKVLSKLDMYSANLVANLVQLQTVQKSIMATVERNKEEEVNEDGGMERSCVERDEC